MAVDPARRFVAPLPAIVPLWVQNNDPEMFRAALLVKVAPCPSVKFVVFTALPRKFMVTSDCPTRDRAAPTLTTVPVKSTWALPSSPVPPAIL